MRSCLIMAMKKNKSLFIMPKIIILVGIVYSMKKLIKFQLYLIF